jgi:hypothetical protein
MLVLQTLQNLSDTEAMSESGDLVDSHRGAGLAQLTYPLAEPSE